MPPRHPKAGPRSSGCGSRARWIGSGDARRSRRAAGTRPVDEAVAPEATGRAYDEPVGSGGAETRLATYGSLAPGHPNERVLAGLSGTWQEGHVRGSLVPAGWGAALGYPALILDAEGTDVAVQVFESADLPAHWSRLDAFEGPGYRRVVATIRTPDGEIDASLYVLSSDSEG